MDRETYLFHQTPTECAKDLMAFVPLVEGDILLEPFKGEGAFYNAFPDTHTKLWAELEQGVDYKTITEPYDWVITNPPFRLDTGGKRVNSFWFMKLPSMTSDRVTSRHKKEYPLYEDVQPYVSNEEPVEAQRTYGILHS